MQVFKAFYKSLRRQITSVLLYVIAFAAISVIMANTMSENTDTLFTAKRLTVAVFDHDNTDESRVLYNYLDRTQKLTSIKDDNEAIADELFFRNVDYVLIIPDGFSENPDSLKNVKQQNSSSAYFLDNSIDTFLNVFFNFRNTGYSCDEAERLTYDCIGSVEELYNEIEKSIAAGFMTANPYKEKGFVPGEYNGGNYDKIDLHRPYVDDIILVSESGKPMKREADLIDVWFDSGSTHAAVLEEPPSTTIRRLPLPA